MTLLEKYPTVGMFLAFFISSCIFAYLNYGIKIAIIVSALCLIALIVVLRLTPLKQKVSHSLIKSLSLILAAISVAGCISAYSFDYRAARIDSQSGNEDNVTLTIESCEYSLSYTSCYVATVQESNLIPKGTKLLLNTELGYLENGAIVKGVVEYSSLDSQSSGTFDGKRYYLSRRIMLIADGTELERIGADNRFSFSRFFDKINRRLTSMFMSHCEYESGGFASAVLLGNKEYLTDSIERDFRRIGITHLIVVSGTHFSVMIALSESLLKKTRIKRNIRALINITLILFMMGLTGFTPSVVRAGIMHLLAQLSVILFRRANIVNSFAIAGTALVLINPYATLDCGLQLSFTATYSCIMFQSLKGSVYRDLKEKTGIRPRRSKIFRILFSIVETVVLTTLVTLSTMPIIWQYFGEISLISIPANVIFIPMITVFMYLSAAYLILYPIMIFTPLLAHCIGAFTDLLCNISACFSSAEWVMLRINYSFSICFLVPIAILLLILPVVHAKARLPVFLSSIVVCLAFFGTVFAVQVNDAKNVYLTYITEKKNDGFVIKAGGEALICDISDGSYSFASNLIREAEEMHLCEIEYLMFTHYHNKHVQLLSRISDREILRGVILPEPIDERENGIYNSLCALAAERNIDILTLPVGGQFMFGDSVITMFERTYVSRSSHPITAVEIEINNESTVILSGAFNESKEDLQSAVNDADCVIFGVHSPVYKKTFGVNFGSEPKVMIVSTDAYEHMDAGTRAYVDIHENCYDSGVFRQVIKVSE